MEEKIALVIITLTAVLIPTISAGKILMYPFGHCFNSHLINFERLGEILLQDGHEVSMLINSQYWNFIPDGALIKNTSAGGTQERVGGLHLIVFEAPSDMTPICEYDTIDWMLHTPISERFDGFIETTSRYCENILKDTNIMSQLKSLRFDLFIMEALDPCSRILADYIDVKFMTFFTAGLGHFDGNPRPPSYVPAPIAPYTSQMSFPQRMGNFLMKTLYESMPMIVGFDHSFELMKIKYNINTSVSLANTMSRASLKLINSDFAMEYPTPIEPDSILVGGFGIRSPEALDSKFASFVAGAGDDGIILFSFGTLVKQFDSKWASMFISTFSRLKQRVLWRAVGMENATGEHTPMSHNILALPWLPQTDLLAHPKTRLLITHCGLNSAMEAATFGVPVIALPMSGDHFNQASKLTEHMGMGMNLDITTLTSDKLFNAITTVLNDPQYMKNAKNVAERIADQPIPKSDQINYWVNYILKHSGAKHLKSVAHRLSWFQYFSLDVILVLLLGVTCVISLFLAFLIKTLSIIWQHIKVPEPRKSKLT